MLNFIGLFYLVPMLLCLLLSYITFCLEEDGLIMLSSPPCKQQSTLLVGRSYIPVINIMEVINGIIYIYKNWKR